MSRFFERFRSFERFGTFLLALILAIIVWAVSEQQQNPLETRTISGVALEARNLPDNLVFINGSPNFPTVDARVRAPRSIFEAVTPNSLGLFVDLSAAGAGRQELEIDDDPTLPNVEVLQKSPTAVVVRLEERIDRDIPVVANVLDTPPFGYDAGEAQIEPATVQVSGAASLVDTVQRAEISVRLLDARSDVEVTNFVTLRDKSGATVTGLEVEPRTVTVKVPIAQTEGVRELTVVPRVTGQPAAGYQWVGVSVDPPSVRITGDQEALDAMPNFVETIPIDINGATDDIEERVPLVITETVSILAAQAVQVTVSIEPIQGSLTVTLKPQLQGLGPGLLNKTISPETIEVILLGPLPQLQTITADLNAQAILQVSNLTEGTYDITPILVLPEKVLAQAVLPDTVRVVISPIPTATPTLGAGSALTSTLTLTPTIQPLSTPGS